MNEELTWKIRHAPAGRKFGQKAVAKACFYWKKDGQLVRSAEFTQSELEAECERLSEAGRDITQFALALIALSNSTGQPEGERVPFDRVDRRRRA